MAGPTPDTADRARQSGGSSDDASHQLVLTWLRENATKASHLVDVGCGRGTLLHEARHLVGHCTGVDVLPHDGFPAGSAFIQADLDKQGFPLPDACSDLVTCVEAIEHVENPRALVRELTRLLRPGGALALTTPN